LNQPSSNPSNKQQATMEAITTAVSSVNLSIEVTELLGKTLENAMKDMLVRAITYCAEKYKFNSQEAIEELGLERIKFVKKPMAKRSGEKKEKEKERKEKSKIPLPFMETHINPNGCQGLSYNRGLFTQCSNKIMENGSYCNKCQSECDKNASGEPNCGTIEKRLNTDLYSFKDPKGRSPVSYIKLLNKLNISREVAEEEAMRNNMTIDESHFLEKQEKQEKQKKHTSCVANDVEDLFAKLTENDETDAEVTKKRVKLTEEEKAAKKAILEAEREQKRLEKEAEKEQKRLEKEAEKEQKRIQREAEKQQREAEKEQKRIQKEAEKEAKKQASKKSSSSSSSKQEETKQEETKQEETKQEEIQTRTTQKISS
jgi:hypothetical protein